MLTSQDVGDPSGRAWTETGEIDHKGHDAGTRLAHEIDVEVTRIARRTRDLLDAGWSVVTIVTDHGWVLLPSGLPKNDGLPVAATVTKKGRCARITDGASVNIPTVPWHWDKDVRIAIAPGISCFEANQPYEHGGVSPQECFVPRLTVTPSAATVGSRAEITSIKWRGLTLVVEFADLPDGAKVDLRHHAGDVESSIADLARVHERYRQGHAARRERGLGGHVGPARSYRYRRHSHPSTRNHCGTEPMTELDDLDRLASQAFDGYLVKKDLAQQFRGQYPVPTYVGEFLLGRYCATTDPDEIATGLEMVQRSMKERTVRAGEEELFKHRAREKGASEDYRSP